MPIAYTLEYNILMNLTAKLAKLIGWLDRLRKTLPTSLLHVVYNYPTCYLILTMHVLSGDL